MSHSTTATTTEIREMVPGDVPAAVGVLARGMRDNPIHVAAYGPDPDRRERAHGKLMAALFRVFTSQEPLVAVRDGALVGVLGVAPVGTCQPTAMQRLRLTPTLVGLGPATARRIGEWLGAWAAQDLDEPHVHLGPVAVDRHLQGTGIGSRMMEEHTARLDRAGEVGYLETDKPENVSFYARFGFEVVAEQAVLGVPNWFMRR